MREKEGEGEDFGRGLDNINFWVNFRRSPAVFDENGPPTGVARHRPQNMGQTAGASTGRGSGDWGLHHTPAVRGFFPLPGGDLLHQLLLRKDKEAVHQSAACLTAAQ